MENNVRKFKVMSSVGEGKESFEGIELNLVITNEEIGADCNVLGGKFKITQNGKIFVLVDPDWVLTLMDITPVPEVKWGHMIINGNELRINNEVEIFFETKEISIRPSERLFHGAGCTYEALFNFLEKEWTLIKELVNIQFPFEYMKEEKLFIMNDRWNFEEGTNISLLREGTFSRKTSDGRFI